MKYLLLIGQAVNVTMLGMSVQFGSTVAIVVWTILTTVNGFSILQRME